MNFRHIEVFYAVMANGTVTEAARHLGVSQPSVTTTLKQAEERLGLALFRREGGRLVPTAEARVLFEEAERAHDALAALKGLATQLRSGQGGHVRIAAIPSISLELLPDAIARFQQDNEGFQYSVSTLNTEEMIAQLDARQGRFHLGFTFGVPEDASVAHQVLGDAELLAVFPAAWKLPPGDELRLEDVADRPLISPFDATPLGQLGRALFHDAGVTPQVVARSHTYHVAGRLVQRRLGFTILDAVTVRALLHDRLSNTITVRRLAGHPTVPLVVMYPGQRSLNRAAEPFIQAFRNAWESLNATVEERLP